MPAAARKISPESYQDHSTASARSGVSARVPGRSTPVRKRWHETPPASRSTPGRRQESDDADWRGLVDHFGGAETSKVVIEEKEVEARRVARRKARLKHRPFRLTVVAISLATAPVALLACLLWMNSSALALSRQDAALQSKIEAARFELQSTRREIAALNASPQIEQWAAQRGWRQATQQDFDDVSKVVTPISSKSSEENDTP